MTELHERFVAWLVGATPGDPPRDLAVHASGCTECLALASGLDALARVDPGLAPMPPHHLAATPRPVRLAPVARVIGGLAAAGLFGFVIISGGALREEIDPIGTPPPNEGVLGAAAGESTRPSDTRSPEASPSDASTPEPEDSPSASASEASDAPRPLTPVTPPGPAPTSVPTNAPQPTAQPPGPPPSPEPPSPSPTPPPPSPTPAPTPTPTPQPTPTPTPTPTCDLTDPECLPSPSLPVP